MKLISFALALLAAIGIVIQPVAPAYALAVSPHTEVIILSEQPLLDIADKLRTSLRTHTPPNLSPAEKKLLAGVVVAKTMAERGNNVAATPAQAPATGAGGIFTDEQMKALAKQHPKLAVKLWTALQSNRLPNLTADEAKLVTSSAAARTSIARMGIDTSTAKDAVILSQAQMDQLAASHLALHAKLAAAYKDGTAPNLTADENKIVAAMTAQNLQAMKAGSDDMTSTVGPGGGSIPAAFFIFFAIILILLLLFGPFEVCKITGFGCPF